MFWLFRVGPAGRQDRSPRLRLRGQDAAERDAEDKLAIVRAGQRHVGTLTVSQYLDEWLAGKRRLRPTTRRGYETDIRLHLKPLIGAVPLSGLAQGPH